MSIGKPSYRKGAKKTSDFKIGISNGKPSIQVNWGGRIYGTQLSLIGSGNVKDSLDVSDIRATGNITFGKNSAVYNNSNKILMVGGLTKSGDKNMTIGTDTNLASMVGDTDNANNITIGDYAMNATVNGKQNIAIGHDVMRYIGRRADEPYGDNYANVALGYRALMGKSDGNNTQAVKNVAIGFNAMYNAHGDDSTSSTTYQNVCIGTSAGFNVSSYSNVFVGTSTGKGNTTDYVTGYENVGIGTSSLERITEGVRNTAVGIVSLTNVTSGDFTITEKAASDTDKIILQTNEQQNNAAPAGLSTGCTNVLLAIGAVAEGDMFDIYCDGTSWYIYANVKADAAVTAS